MKTIPLTQGKFALVDDEDYERLNVHKWFAHRNPCTKSYYAARTSKKSDGGKKRLIRMHSEVMNAKSGECVDHINHDTLDNRQGNLRACTVSQNGANSRARVTNTSGFKGVCWYKRDQKWHAYINISGKRKHLGYHSTAEDAARVYDAAAIKHNGEFALTNKMLGLLPE